MAQFDVIVGNIGTVYSGDDQREAEGTYNQYVVASKVNAGRAAGEPVTMIRNGEPIHEYDPATSTERNPLVNWTVEQEVAAIDRNNAARRETVERLAPKGTAAARPMLNAFLDRADADAKASKAPKGLFPGSLGGKPHPTMMFKATGEFRPPKEDEFYLSGAIIHAWQAANDLSTAYWIAVPVEMIRCPHCQGTGKVEKPSTRWTDIARRQDEL